MDLRISFEASSLETRFDHAQTAVWEDRTLEWLIGLQAYDNFVVAIDVTRFVRQQCLRGLCVDSQNAFFPLFLEVRLQFGPHRLGLGRRRREKFLVAGIGRHVANDEIPHTDRSPPVTGSKATPWVLLLVSTSFARAALLFMAISPYFGVFQPASWPADTFTRRWRSALI